MVYTADCAYLEALDMILYVVMKCQETAYHIIQLAVLNMSRQNLYAHKASTCFRNNSLYVAGNRHRDLHRVMLCRKLYVSEPAQTCMCMCFTYKQGQHHQSEVT